jgi:hypothetical protein
MKLRLFFFAMTLAVCFSTPAFAQDDNPFLLKRGNNEFSFWAGFSAKATTMFKGLHNNEAEDRKFFISALRYGRTLAANDTLAFQYTVDAVPVAVATGTIVSRTTSISGVETFQRETGYGAGITPIGLQLDFANGAKVHPFVHINGGFLYFNKSMPIEGSGQFQYVGEIGGGMRIFTSERRAVNIGVMFHHISNGDRTGTNRGLNQFVIYAGFSIFR